jgi:hypothetical protein
VKRVDLIRHLEAHGCRLLREGGSHSVYLHPAERRTSTVPRHREVDDFLAEDLSRSQRPAAIGPILRGAAERIVEADGPFSEARYARIG